MNYYLKFGDVTGDVTEPAHRSWIELDSWSDVLTTSGRAIKASKKADNASAVLWQYCASGKTADAVIDLVRESGGVYFRMEMSLARILSFQTWNELESLEIVYEKIERKKEPGTPPP